MGCHFLPQGIVPTQGIKPMSLVPPALAGRFFTTGAIWEALLLLQKVLSLHSWSHGERELQRRSYARPFGQTETTPPQRSPEKPEKGPWFHLSLLECFFFFFFFFFPFLQMAAFNEEALSAKIGNLQPGCSQGVHPPSAVRREHHCSAGGLRPLR